MVPKRLGTAALEKWSEKAPPIWRHLMVREERSRWREQQAQRPAAQREKLRREEVK